MRSKVRKIGGPARDVAGETTQKLVFSFRFGAFVAVSGLLCGCAGQPTQDFTLAAKGLSSFDPRYGVRASPRVVADGEEVPEGGGRYQVGKPYKIAGKTYYPSEKPYAAAGTASWYGSDFHGRLTANGEVFDRNALTAAHPTMPLPSYARVTNAKNNYSIVVRVNDRGPYHGGRVMDVSQRVAEALDFRSAGTAHVKVEWLGRAKLDGGDKGMLQASLRTDGEAATLPGVPAPTLVAERERPVHTAYAETARRDEPRSIVDRTSDADEDVAAPTPPTRASSEKSAEHADRVAPLPPSRPYGLGVAKSKNGAKLAAQ
jgi:rare lipoprotein A